MIKSMITFDQLRDAYFANPKGCIFQLSANSFRLSADYPIIHRLFSELLLISKKDGFESIRDFIMYHTKNLDEFGRKTYIQFGAQSWLK